MNMASPKKTGLFDQKDSQQCEDRRLKRTEREKQREEQRKRREERRKERESSKAKRIQKQGSTGLICRQNIFLRLKRVIA